MQNDVGVSCRGAQDGCRPKAAPTRMPLYSALMFACLYGCGSAGPEAQLSGAVSEQTLAQAIVDGQKSARDDYPATGVIIYRTRRHGVSGGAMLCSATLIAPDVVIAAGHCEAGLLGETDYATTFYFTLSLDVSGSAIACGALPDDAVRITRFVPHPEFSLDNLGTGLRFAKDIALLVLEHSIDAVAPATLIRREQSDALVRGAEVLIVGYGRRHPWGLGATDMGVKYQGTSHINEIAPFEMQVGQSNPGSYKCHGDSGGPTYMQLPQTQSHQDVSALTLVGITSRIYTHGNCGTGGTDTRIDPYLPWIARTLNETCRTGVRPSCR